MNHASRLLRRILLALTLLPAVHASALNTSITGQLGMSDPRLDGIFDYDPLPDVPPIEPVAEPMTLRGVGNRHVELRIRTRAGTNKLYRSLDAQNFTFLGTLAPESDLDYVDEGLGVGVKYCYRLDMTSGGQTKQDFLCATTDWRVGFTKPHFTAEETQRVLDVFDWRDTQTLLEGGEDEPPALYYMNVLVDDTDAPEGLRKIGVHVEATPLFGEETAGFLGSHALVREGGVVTGRWYFAVVPGHFYNEIRERVLAQIDRGEEPGVRAMVFRKLPVYDARAYPLDASRLSYQYLGERGFVFNGEVVSGCVYDEELGGEICPYLLGWVVRKLAGWAWEGAESLVEGVRMGLGYFQRIYKEEVELAGRFRVLNTDPAFNGPGDGGERYMVSAWNGQPLVLRDVRVQIRQGVAAFYEHTGSDGRFRKTVLKGVDTQVCVETENDVAELTEFLTEEVVCLPSIGKLTADTVKSFDVKDPYLNTLAGMTDAHDYVEQVWGHDMPKISVLVGDMADQVALAGRSFAPCMGRVPGSIGLAADALMALIHPGLLGFSALVEFNYAVDIVLRSEDDDSRGVPVHEYGHAVMCSLLGAQGADAFQLAWTDVIFATSDQSAGNDTSYLNEAFADFLTSQVLGGTNYFAPSADFMPAAGVNYCLAGSDCVEENFSDRSTFSGQVARVVSLLQDAFDDPGDPSDGSHWDSSPGVGLLPARAADSSGTDEAIALAPTDLPAIFARWDERGTLMNEDNFLGGLADLLQARGYGEADVCALFALHDGGASCPAFALSAPWMAWYANLSSPALLFQEAGPTLAPQLGALQPVAGPPAGAAPQEAPPIALLEGVQKTKVKAFGKEERESAYAFRLGEGWFEGVAPDGARFGGGFSERGKAGGKLRLHAAPEFEDEIAEMIAASLDGLDEVALAGPVKIVLKVRGDGSVAAKVKAAFLAGEDGKERKGKYVAKLRGALQ